MRSYCSFKMQKSLPDRPTQPKQYWQPVSEAQRTRYELCEQESQSMQCWQLSKPRDPRQCNDSVHMLQSRPETVWSRKPESARADAVTYQRGLAGLVDTLVNPLAARSKTDGRTGD